MTGNRLFVVVGVLLIVLVLSACSSPQATATPQATPVVVSPARSGGVVADAQVVPVRWVALSFQAGGLVDAVNAQEGSAVKAGDVLVQLDDTDAKLAVAQAEAALAVAQAQLAQAQARPRAEQIAVAEQGVREAEAGVLLAEAQLLQLQTGVRPADIAAAEAGLAQAAYSLKVAQNKYDFAEKGDERRDAQNALELARQNYAAAQKRLNQLKAGPTQAELEAARAGIAAAQALQAQAQAQVDLAKAGATAEQVAVAQAGVDQAQAAVDLAKAQLAHLQLVAPFDGVVVSLDARPGQLAAPGAPVVWLADFSAWQIETDDLTELSVVRVREGDPVVIAFDAIPDLELTGKVVRIKAFGENKQGDIVYTVVIQPDRQDERLRWNMTASVTIGNK